MTATVLRVSGQQAYDLTYPEFLSKLSDHDLEIMARHMFNSSHVWIGYKDSEILCYLGLIPPTVLSDRAYLWLNVTEHMQEHVFLFVRYSQRVVAEMLREYPLIVGHTQTANTRAIRWLRWLGAEFFEPVNPFALPFEIRAR